MSGLLTEFEKRFLRFFARNSRFLLGGFCIGVLSYFMMLSLNLVNDIDGIWHLSNFIAGDWEISLGRGLQRYADRFRFGIVSDPFNSMLTLLLFELANVMILERFSLQKGPYPWLLLTILTANPVVCNTLTYSYMSVNFGLACFFSVLAFYLLKTKDTWKRSLIQGSLCGALLGISLSFYQAYISVTAVLALLLMIKWLGEEKKLREILEYLALFVYTVLFAGGAYLLITNGLLFRAGIRLASYRGADENSLSRMLLQLPASLVKCYTETWSYFVEKKAFANLEFIDLLLAALAVCYLAALGMRFFGLYRKDKKRALLFLLLVVLLPPAGCAVLLIAVGSPLSVLMSMGPLLGFSLLGILLLPHANTGFWVKRACLFFLALFAWYQLSAVTNDQLALKEGKTATITLTENIVSRLYREGYMEKSPVVAFVGRPGDNDQFAQSTAYRMANGYAKFGCWSTDARNNRVSWYGVTSNFLGVNINLCGEEEYKTLIRTKQVADMPEFPAAESVCTIDGIVVVKVSDLY